MYTWVPPLSIDIARLSSHYVVCHTHEKFKFYCPLIISSRILIASWLEEMFYHIMGSNMFCTYHKPRKCEHMRLCHLELILLIISFLGGMFAQTSSTFIKKLLLLILWVLVWVRNSWCSFPQIHISISYLGHRLLQVIIIIVVRDCLTSWSYQESPSMHSA